MMSEKIKCLISYFVMLIKLIVVNKKNRILLFNSPEHGNLGDHAISLSEIQFFRKYSLNYVELSGKFCRRFFNFIKHNVVQTDIVCVTGGGFLGSLWKQEDIFVQKLIVSFPNNKILIFPQTLYFEKGTEYINDFRKVYSAHQNLIFMHREKCSLSIGNDILFGSKVRNVLMPDMVLLYRWKTKKSNGEEKGKKILFCFRDDKESILKQEEKNNIMDYCKQIGYHVQTISTVLNHSISLYSRKNELNNLLLKMNEASLVITDRLHGMLLSVIAGTPCIALDNLSGKVFNVWDCWLKSLKQVKYVSSSELLDVALMELLLSYGHYEFELPNVNDYYTELVRLCNE